MSNQYGITSQGFVRKPLTVITSDLNARFVREFGTGFDTSPENPDGQVIGIVSDVVSELWDLAQAACNSYRPGATEGVGLDSVVEINRVKRYVNVPTTVMCYVDGTEGVTVPAGSIVATEDGNYSFTLDEDVTIPDSVTVTCTTEGENYVAANTVTKIATEIDGWTSVNNPDEGSTGITYESDGKLRARRENSTIVTGKNTTEAIHDALTRLGVDYVRIRDNDDDKPTGSQPANSFQVVVVGKTDRVIAQTIYNNKPGGIKAYGTTNVTVNDSKGYPHNIGFTRPVNASIYLKVTFKRYSGSSADSENTIVNALCEYINGLNPGENVVWSKLFCPISTSTQLVEIDSLLISRTDSDYGTKTLEIDIDERAYIEPGFIDITDIT
ncbi:hypothetical protein EHW66_17960 [Erwinia psidii]|uniref:baseplate J/gp47 family protein n=1 Tax=Erwinia psidii TaxID=69224 RepID=UPI00226BB1BF|nr:hypothetical protein [Erwinia psidii]MCX8966799.1 hypothetical protein [Erwinia psidii]